MNKYAYESCALALISFALCKSTLRLLLSLATYNARMHPCYNNQITCAESTEICKAKNQIIRAESTVICKTKRQ